MSILLINGIETTMTLYDFIALSDDYKAQVVWGSAYIADREDQGHRILLYQVQDFYVEVYHHKEHNTIEKFTVFATTDQLQPYLEQIDITKLLK
ncbi:MAG: hypothetical protein ICV65_08380 [Flavisolibacter sp.]|nr:hypothetical protein [Flavisolibacter sp.]